MKQKNWILFFGSAVVLAAVYFSSRLFHIMSLPIFTDEAIYVRWAQIAKNDANWRFISLVDGKQPMFIWIAILTQKLFHDPLFATRLVSVGAGFFTAIGLFFLGNEVFRDYKKGNYKLFEFTQYTVAIGFVSSLLYVFYSFGLVYDRMALYDSLVGTFAVWSLYVLILLVRSLRLDVALIAGMVIGAGMLTKTNAFFSLYSMPFLLAIIEKTKNLQNRLFKFIGLCLVTIVVANAIYSILRLSPYYHIINEKNALFVYPFHEWIQHPFTYLLSNLQGLDDWFWRYFSIPWMILSIAAFFIHRKKFLEKAVLVFWFAFPFAGLAFFGNTIYPRFILFMTLSLIPLVAYSFVELWKKYPAPFVRIFLILFTVTWMVYTDYFIVTDFSHAPIPKSDTSQYENNWTGGNGVAQSVQFLSQQAAKGKIFIATQGTFGLMPYGFEIYLVDNPNVTMRSYWPTPDKPTPDIAAAAKKMPTYVAFYQPCPGCKAPGIPPIGWSVQLIGKYKQGTSNSYFALYQVLPE